MSESFRTGSGGREGNMTSNIPGMMKESRPIQKAPRKTLDYDRTTLNGLLSMNTLCLIEADIHVPRLLDTHGVIMTCRGRPRPLLSPENVHFL